MELTIPQALQKGISAHQSGKLKDAENFYRAILKAQPNNPHANHNLGALAAQLGRFEEALPLFKQAIDANSSEEQYWLSYMHLLINMGRVSDASDILEQSRNFGLSKNKIKEIEDILGRSHEDTILSKELDNLLGLYNSRKFEKALEYGHSLAIQFPDTPSILHLLGTIKSALGMVKEARLDYERVLEIKPDSSDTYNNMATLLKRTGHLDNAKLAYKKAIVLYPNYIDANYNFANLLNEGRYYEGALTLYNRALTIKYDFPEAHTNLGTILKNLNRNREAINAFRNAIKFKPDSTEAHFNLGSSLEEAGELSNSQLSFYRSLLLTPNKWECYLEFGRWQQFRGNFNVTLKLYRAGKMLNPEISFVDVYASSIINRADRHTLQKGNNLFACPLEKEGVRYLRKSLNVPEGLDHVLGLLPSFTPKQERADKAQQQAANIRNGLVRHSQGFNLFKERNNIIQKVKLEIIQKLKNTLGCEIFACDSFFAIYEGNSVANPHMHLTTWDKRLRIESQKYAAVYYVKVGDQLTKEPGHLKFHNPELKLLPKEGDLVIFPAETVHSVEYNGTDRRVILGINFYAIL
ncbi:tetratricopeptide repeat protein [Alphaproteobacteria bacterium]|nr:tetratricopeptide repeat protein [Alphaproteobacteria bacterium]